LGARGASTQPACSAQSQRHDREHQHDQRPDGHALRGRAHARARGMRPASQLARWSMQACRKQTSDTRTLPIQLWPGRAKNPSHGNQPAESQAQVNPQFGQGHGEIQYRNSAISAGGGNIPTARMHLGRPCAGKGGLRDERCIEATCDQGHRDEGAHYSRYRLDQGVGPSKAESSTSGRASNKHGARCLLHATCSMWSPRRTAPACRSSAACLRSRTCLCMRGVGFELCFCLERRGAKFVATGRSSIAPPLDTMIGCVSRRYASVGCICGCVPHRCMYT